MDKNLFVPVRIEALIAGDHTEPAADMEYNFEQLDILPVGANISNSLFTRKDILPGVHLHWIMPDALLHGRESEGSAVFPPLPDRYILHRLWEEDGRIRRRSFLIKSNYCSNTENKTCQGMVRQTIPLLKQQDGIWDGGGRRGEKYAFWGGVTDMDAPGEEDGFLLDEVTAVGMGDPIFSAFYERSKTVLGFYDSCEDIPRGTLTYCLCGYYENEEQDPLKDAEWGRRFWRWQEKETPGRTILHGCIQTLEWKGSEAVYESAVPKGDPDIYIANNSMEAMAAYMSRNITKSGNSERMLHGMMSGVLENTDGGNPDGLLELEESLHERQFGIVDAGSVWTIRSDIDREDILQKRKSAEPEALRILNETQREYDRLRQENEDLKKEGYGLWCRYLYQFTPSPFQKTQTEERLSEIEAALTRIEEKEAEADKLKSEIIKIKNSMEKLLEGSAYKLTEEKLRFYEPLAPVLLIPGAGSKKLQGFQTAGESDKDGRLPCRQAVLSSLQVELYGKVQEITGKELLEWTCPDGVPVAEQAEAILYEALLLSCDFNRALAITALRQAGREYRQQDADILAERITDWKKQPERWKGSLPDLTAYVIFQPPWNPILMQWRINLTPLSGRDIRQDTVLNRYRLKELDFEAKDACAESKAVEYTGSTMLTPHASFQAKYRLERLMERRRPSHALMRLAQSMADYDILSQRMDGMIEKRLLQEKAVSIPVCRFGQVPEELLKKMCRYLDRQDTVPLKYGRMEDFLPIGEGILELTGLWVVDSFGQIKELNTDSEHIRISEVLETGEPGKALLRPRFPKPCRLEAELLPVEGFLLPGFTDRTLRFYDGKGVYLGTLAASARGVVWMQEEAAKRGTPLSAHMEGLRDSLQGLEVSRFSDFLDQLDDGYGCRMPLDGEVSPGLYFGKNLAVVRARVQIREMGLRALAQTAEETGGRGYENILFPVQIGDTRKVREGIFGFFSGSDPASMYGKDELLFQECGRQVSLSLAGGPVEMTLLFDPMGKGYLTSGCLPKTVIQLDHECYLEQTRGIEAHLNIAPLLVHEGMPDIPVPGGEIRRDGWDFLSKDKNGLWQEEKTEPIQALPQEKALFIKEGYLKWRT